MDQIPQASEATQIIDELFDRASSEKLDNIVDLASEHNINLIEVRNLRQQTILHVASGFGRRSIVTYLAVNGANVNAQDADGQTPLHYACNHGHNTVTRMLIGCGANVNLVDSKGRTPLHFIVAKRVNAVKIDPSYWKVVESLLEFGTNPFLKSSSGHNCFSHIQDDQQRLFVRLGYIAFKLRNLDDSDSLGHEETIDRYLRIKDFFELVKIGNDHFEVLEASLTKRLINSRLESHVNITPLHRAAGYDLIKVAQLLIVSGADVNAVDDNGRIPLHNAAHHGHVEMISLLSSSGSEIDKQDCDGSSPLHLAAAAKKCPLLACQTLMGHGANTSLMNSDDKLPYDLANSSDVKELLNISKTLEESTTERSYANLVNIDGPLLGYINEEIENELSKSALSSNKFSDKKIVIHESDWAFQSIKKRMHDTIGVHSGEAACQYRSYDINSIELIINRAVWTKHKLKRKSLEIDHGSSLINERLLFHGSSFIDNIVSKGFSQSYANRKGMFGAGLYFAEHSSKSNQYTFGWNQVCPKHKDKSCQLCERVLILAIVTLGKCFETKEELPDLNHAPPGHSSVAGEPGRDLCYPEYCIYNGDQAYPSFVIRYRIKH